MTGVHEINPLGTSVTLSCIKTGYGMRKIVNTYDIVPLGAPFDHFGGHVFDGAAKRVGPLLPLVSGQFLGQTKIGEDDMSILIHQDVF